MHEERNSFTVGEEAELSKTISKADIAAYAALSGDTNPIHLDDVYARGTRFGGTVAHGMLVAGLISAVLGTSLPGPGAIYMGQQLRFLAPVFPETTVTARVRVTEYDSAKGRLTLLTEVIDDNNVTVITGEAKLVMQSALKNRETTSP